MNIETDKAKNELLQKIGRNLLLFQKLETLLKSLVISSRSESDSTGLTEKSQKRKDGIQKVTLGSVAQQYLNDVHANSESNVPTEENSGSIRMITRFSLQRSPVELAGKEQSFQSLVSERNEFVHHLLPSIDFSSVDSMTALGERLDSQRERVKAEIDEAENILQSFNSIIADVKKIFASDLVITALHASILSTSPIVALLREIASDPEREDGWTLLSHAGHVLHKALPEDMQSLKSTYGEKNLKAIMVKSGNFEFKDEPTQKGGILSLYRNRLDGNDSVQQVDLFLI